MKPAGRVLITDFRFGSLRGWRGPVFRAVTWTVERLAGHYEGYQSFKDSGGIPPLADATGLRIEREKIVAGGNLGIYVMSPAG